MEDSQDNENDFFAIRKRYVDSNEYFRMCKKIAQLVKLVANQQVQIDDFSDQTFYLVKTFEREFDDIIYTGQKKIEQHKIFCEEQMYQIEKKYEEKIIELKEEIFEQKEFINSVDKKISNYELQKSKQIEHLKNKLQEQEQQNQLQKQEIKRLNEIISHQNEKENIYQENLKEKDEQIRKVKLQNGKFIREVKSKNHVIEKLKLEIKKNIILNTNSESEFNLPTIQDIPNSIQNSNSKEESQTVNLFKISMNQGITDKSLNLVELQIQSQNYNKFLPPRPESFYLGNSHYNSFNKQKFITPENLQNQSKEKIQKINRVQRSSFTFHNKSMENNNLTSYMVNQNNQIQNASNNNLPISNNPLKEISSNNIFKKILRDNSPQQFQYQKLGDKKFSMRI